MSDSGISVDTGSTSSNNSGLVNLNALAKLGTISVNAQGEKIFDFVTEILKTCRSQLLLMEKVACFYEHILVVK